MMSKIYTNKSEEILVDDSLYEKLNKKTWYISSNGYAESTIILMSRKKSRETGKNRTTNIKMHRVVYELANGVSLTSNQHIDHIDRNKLNNRIDNLRICEFGESSTNQINNGIRKDNTSGYKGVTFRKSTGKYEAKISFKGKRKWIGAFDKPEEAALAYNKSAQNHFGDRAYLNSIDNNGGSV